MGEGQLHAVAAALSGAVRTQPTPRLAVAFALLLAAGALAQGPVYREQWKYLHLEQRRLEVLAALQAADADTAAAVARSLAAPGNGVEFAPVANALALLRGVPADEAFVVRASIGAFVLPEIVDPEATQQVCRELNVSIFLAPGPAPKAAFTFDVEVADAAGKVVATQRVDRDTGLVDLRMARAVAKIPVGELADGPYTVVVRTLLDGEAPRPADAQLQWRFAVLRGYQARCEAALTAARDALPGLAGLPQALLDGLWREVGRAYTGEPFIVRSEAVRDLERLEAALANLAAGRPVLSGMQGDIPTRLPGAGGDGMQCVLRLVAGDTPRPLVVFVSATPAYDLVAPRPTAPGTRQPGWTAHDLARFAAGRDWNVVCLESPGVGKDHFAALQGALAALRELLPPSPTRPVLVCDREAAAVLAPRADRLATQLAGLVLVGAGVPPPAVLARLGELPVRWVCLDGYPATASVDRLLAFLAERKRTGEFAGDVGLLTERRVAWPFGLPLLQAEIEAFAAARFAAQ